MPEITAALVKDLREKTGAGMMDCKRALTETGGEIEAAVDWLRKKGLAAAAKKSGRVAAEGLVGIASAPGRAAMVEVNAETDFVARNEQFQAFVEAVAKVALHGRRRPGGDQGRAVPRHRRDGGRAPDPAGRHDRREHDHPPCPRAVVAERRGRDLRAPALRPGLGKIGVLVAIEGGRRDGGAGDARPPGRHAHRGDAARGAGHHGVDPAALEREKAVLIDAGPRSPAGRRAIIEKMVEGRIRKYYEEVVLLEQVWVHDGESRVKAVVPKAGVSLLGFARFLLGEGIDKPQGPDFASEVAKTAGV